MKLVEPTVKPLFGIPVSPWRWWFAWRPVVTWDGRLCWLVPVMRRLIQKSLYLDGPDFSWSEYHFPWGYVDTHKALI